MLAGILCGGCCCTGSSLNVGAVIRPVAAGGKPPRRLVTPPGLLLPDQGSLALLVTPSRGQAFARREGVTSRLGVEGVVGPEARIPERGVGSRKAR